MRKFSILRSLEVMASEQKNCLHKARLADKVFFATATAIERGGIGKRKLQAFVFARKLLPFDEVI